MLAQSKCKKFVKLWEVKPSFIFCSSDSRPSERQINYLDSGHADILMGKNTMIRKAIRGHLQTNPDLEKLLPHIVGNVGFVFTNGDLSEIRAKLLENRRVRFIDTFWLFPMFARAAVA